MTHPNNRSALTKDANNSQNLAGSGKLFIISAPSGAGKTTLCNAILKHFTDIVYSVSTTTRAPRPGEENGKDYFFVSEDEFVLGIEKNRWAEWAKVHDNYYGTSAAFIKMHLDQGNDILLDIDILGTRQILKKFSESITIFIMPPSIEVLEKRMAGRGTEKSDVMAKRIKNAQSEISQKDFYGHIIVNDKLDVAEAELIKIIQSHRKSL